MSLSVQGFTSALSALFSPPGVSGAATLPSASSSASSGVNSGGSNYELSSGAPLSSGSGSATATTGFSVTTLLIIGAVGIGALFLWKKIK